MFKVSQPASAQVSTQASAESLLTRVEAAKKRIPGLINFLDTIPKQSVKTVSLSSVFSQPKTAGMVAYLEKMSPTEKTLIVRYYADINNLLDEKIKDSKKKHVLTQELSKVLIEGCALLNATRNVEFSSFPGSPSEIKAYLESPQAKELVMEIRAVLKGIDSHDALVKITHAHPSAITKDMKGLIHTQVQVLPQPPTTTFSSINIEALQETLKKLFPDIFYDRRPAMEMDRGATAGGGGSVRPAALAKPINPGVLGAEDKRVQAIVTKGIKPLPTPANMGGANGMANENPLLSQHIAMRGGGTEYAAVSAALIASELGAIWGNR